MPKAGTRAGPPPTWPACTTTPRSRTARRLRHRFAATDRPHPHAPAGRCGGRGGRSTHPFWMILVLTLALRLVVTQVAVGVLAEHGAGQLRQDGAEFRVLLRGP